MLGNKFEFLCDNVKFAEEIHERLKPGSICIRAGPDISGAQGEITTRGPYYKDQNNNLISF